MLSGCGGGGGQGTTATPPSAVANRVPVITSAANVSAVENATDVVLNATATDADGDPVTWGLSGADAAKFTLGATGALRFAAAPNFERPADADLDNRYVVELTASDGKGTTVQAVTITVTNSREGVDVQRIGTGFTGPVSIDVVPESGQLMVAERSGGITLYDPSTRQRTPFFTVEGLTTAERQGIIGIAVQPDFPTRHIAYALISRQSHIVLRHIFSDGGRSGWLEFPLGRRVDNSNDIGGWLGFGPDRRLYVATQDSGGTLDPSGSAQSGTSYFGKLLAFSTAQFDAFSGAAVPAPIAPIVLARGLHRPIGGSFYAGGLLLPDIGQVRNEEVNALPLVAGTIDNLGWPFRDGTDALASEIPAGLTPPVLQYPHGDGTYAGRQIVGGVVYRGSIASLAGTYIFLDAGGAVFTVPLASLQRGNTVTGAVFERRDLDFTPTAGTLSRPVSMAQDAAGTLYIACDNGDIFRVTAG
ncbi:hypothetical protein ASE65_06740 [Sphingomonas sp. Leaf16]|nr:hypothetical protein ASE65_06740 [Sphingomonas sp. Leaf16]KQN13164.1 hypothetical protein ASE81_07755 [Sphingomonas sp. Leaf29]KQN20049.1 hypothetical protein ASE83_07680 [Sphingomonas sp. Leaf32]